MVTGQGLQIHVFVCFFVCMIVCSDTVYLDSHNAVQQHVDLLCQVLLSCQMAPCLHFARCCPSHNKGAWRFILALITKSLGWRSGNLIAKLAMQCAVDEITACTSGQLPMLPTADKPTHVWKCESLQSMLAKTPHLGYSAQVATVAIEHQALQGMMLCPERGGTDMEKHQAECDVCLMGCLAQTWPLFYLNHIWYNCFDNINWACWLDAGQVR